VNRKNFDKGIVSRVGKSPEHALGGKKAGGDIGGKTVFLDRKRGAKKLLVEQKKVSSYSPSGVCGGTGREKKKKGNERPGVLQKEKKDAKTGLDPGTISDLKGASEIFTGGDKKPGRNNDNHNGRGQRNKKKRGMRERSGARGLQAVKRGPCDNGHRWD